MSKSEEIWYNFDPLIYNTHPDEDGDYLVEIKDLEGEYHSGFVRHYNKDLHMFEKVEDGEGCVVCWRKGKL